MLRIIVSLLLLSSGAHATLTESLTGANPSEKSLRWAWKHLGDFVRSCSAAPECQDPQVKKVIDQLVSYLPLQTPLLDSPWAKRLQFASEKVNPALFQTGVAEPHRIAVTEKTKTAHVTINTDALESLSPQSLAKWVGILAHETVHHLGYDDDEKRLPDLVGAAVSTHFQKNIVSSDLAEFGHPEIVTIIFNSPVTDVPFFGIKLRTFYAPTSDFSWVELNIDNNLEGYFLTDKIIHGQP